MKGEQISARHLAHRIVFIYALIGSLWILFSDRLLKLLVDNESLLTDLQTLKGWGFIFVTSLLLYAITHKQAEKERNIALSTEQAAPAKTEMLLPRDREHLLEQLWESEARHRQLFEGNPQPLWVYDLETLAFLAVNDAAIYHYGYSRQEFLSMTIRDMRPAEDIPALLEVVSKRKSGLNEAGTWKHRKKNGTLIDVEITAYALVFAGRPAKLVLANDVTKRKQAEEQLLAYAYYDSLTHLPNRAFFLDQLQQLIHLTHPEDRLFAVLFLDLDRFQMFKYSLGYRFAERLLVATAERLKTCLSLTSTIARVGADEFAILLPKLQATGEAIRCAEHICQEMSLPFNLDEREVSSTITMGVALSDLGYEQAEDFLQAADTAVHQAKRLGKGRYLVFDPTMHVGAVARLQLETDLRQAIECQQLQTYYQPIVSLQTGKITGFEALVRWSHPKRGLVLPAEFILLAEETGLIGLIDRWVLREACYQLSIWQRAFPQAGPLTMSVNLSAVQLAQLSLLERLDCILHETGIERQSLKLEITESAILNNTASEVKILEQLKGLGVQLSIDDFGTGYSSLARLQQLPIDTLKIDRSFINRLDVDDQSWEIIRTIAALAANLGMEVIAEGVETAPQLEQLRTLKCICQYGQGYLFSRPVDGKTAGELLAAALQW